MKGLCWADDDIPALLLRICKAGHLKAIARELRRLQKGERPTAYRMLQSFGPQVGELKRGPLRVVYTTELELLIAIICVFKKDAKSGDKMRPEHERLINSGLRRIRQREYVQDSGAMRKYLH